MTGVRCNASTSGGTGLNVAESLSTIQNFCQNVPQVGMGDNYSTLAKTGLGDSNIRLSIAFSDGSACETRLIIDERTCEQEFYQIVNACGSTSNDDLGFYGGSVTQECALFSIAAEVEEIVRCGGNPSSRATNMDTRDVEKAIDQYCSQTFELSPTPQQIASFITTVPSGQSYHNYLSDGVLIRTTAQFSDQAQHDCEASQSFDTKGDECRRKLTTVYENCGGEGGGLSENGVNGCVVWTMWGETLK